MTEFINSKSIKKLNKDIDKISKGLLESASKLTGAINQELFAGANDIRNDIINSMVREKKTGIVYNRKRGKTHRASAPGEAPAVDSGELLRGVLFGVKDLEMEVGAVSPYARFLEDGTKNMDERPFLEPAVDKNKDNIVKNIGKAGVIEIVKPLDETL